MFSRPVLIGRGLGAKRCSCSLWSAQGQRTRHAIQVSGGHSGGVTPVPIPNTEVKPASADGTWGETPWESRSPPEYLMKTSPRIVGGFFVFPRQYARLDACTPAVSLRVRRSGRQSGAVVLPPAKAWRTRGEDGGAACETRRASPSGGAPAAKLQREPRRADRGRSRAAGSLAATSDWNAGTPPTSAPGRAGWGRWPGAARWRWGRAARTRRPGAGPPGPNPQRGADR